MKGNETMARGNGKQAQVAMSSGKLGAFVKPKGSADGADQQREFVDWGEVNGHLIAGAVTVAVREGGALLLGCSRDKTAYSVKVYVGGEGTAYYFPCNERGIQDLEDFLTSIIDLAG